MTKWNGMMALLCLTGSTLALAAPTRELTTAKVCAQSPANRAGSPDVTAVYALSEKLALGTPEVLSVLTTNEATQQQEWDYIRKPVSYSPVQMKEIDALTYEACVTVTRARGAH